MYYTAEQKIDIINEFYLSKLSVYKFSEIKGLGKMTLYKWLKKYRESNEELFSDDYVPILSNYKNDNIDNGVIVPIDQSPVIKETKKREITIIKNDVQLNFDISLLSEVMEVLK